MTALPEESSNSTITEPQKSNSLQNQTLITESKQIRELLSKQDFHHFTERQCLITIKKTKFRSLKLKIDILPNYPSSNHSLIIEITSIYLCNRLIKQLNKGINKIIATNQCKPRIFLIIKSLHDIIQNNMLTYAFNEVYKIKKMFKKNKTITLKVHETKGKIDFKLKNNEYSSHFIMNIPELYPLSPVQFKIKSCSFPTRYQHIYASQINNICHKLSKGFDISYILNDNRNIKTKGDTSIIDNKSFNSNTALDIRQDLKTMHKMSLFHNKLMENKKVRRKIRVMNKQVKEEEKKENDFKKELERKCIDPNLQQNEPLPSLLVCMEYLVQQFSDLALNLCPFCQKRVFPKCCKVLQEYEDNAKKYVNKGKYPQRCNCGCWYHHECLDMYLSEPPFGKKCVKCEVILKQPLFETDVKALERRWAVKQAKKRELDDVDEFINDMFD